MKLVEIFDKLMETRQYCQYNQYWYCDGCPYENEPTCSAAISDDVEKVRERLEEIGNG